MRNAFRDAVYQLAQRDPRVVLLSADIGNRMFDQFKADFPDRFYNVGIAEQNMIGLAAGLAMAGLRPYCYTIANFTTYRVIEQLRVDLCYHHQPVIVAGVGGGLSYATLGSTHHSCEDIGMLRSLPDMQILCPGDPPEVTASVQLAAQRDDGPTYIRLGKKGEPPIHPSTPTLKPNTWLTLKNTDKTPDITILSCGNILPVALETTDQLAAAGITTRLLSCISVKPLDTATLQHAFAQSRLVVTLEEHSTHTGFGSAVAEWLTDQPTHQPHARLLRLGTPDAFLHRTGSQKYARALCGLTPDALTPKIQAALSTS